MRNIPLIILIFTYFADANNDSSSSNKLNMDAVYDRPFITDDDANTAIGGYFTVDYSRDVFDGISEGHNFSIPRLSIFLNSNLSSYINFLAELELESGGKEISIEYAALDLVLDQLLVLRGGIIVNPIGSYNQNHDDPKWEFVRRPVYATQLLPVTFSSVGFGLYGKGLLSNWTVGYELYLTNGFDGSIIDNSQSKTYLPAIKNNFERFEESENGKPMFTGKLSIKSSDYGEFGLSTLLATYNSHYLDGIEVDYSRGLSVIAFDYNSELPIINSTLTTEFAFINVDIPHNYFKQYGRKQFGWYMDLVRPLTKFNFMNFQDIESFIAIRLDYVDWNVAKFEQTGNNVGDEYFSITPALSLRPDQNTVIKFNYSYSWIIDFLGNEPTKVTSIIIGISSYF